MTDPVQAHARARPDAPAVVTPDAVWTWRDLDAHVEAAAGRMRALAEPHPALGAAVAMLAPTAPETVAAVLGAWRAGVALVPLSPRWPDAALTGALDRLGLSRVVDASGEREARNDQRARSPYLTVVHTSGTTGAPRAAVHTVANHVASARGLASRIPLAPTDRWLLDLPLAHVGGLCVVVRCALAGAAVAIPAPGDLASLAPTHASLVPTQLHRLLAAGVAPPPSLRAVLLGGAASSPSLLARAVRAGWPVATSYGLTEMTSTVAATAPVTGADGLDALASAGDVLPGRDVRLTRAGEIIVSGATLFAGYADGDTLTPPPSDGFATGDLGAWDDAGRLVVTGRIGNRFTVGGENVQAEAVEAALAAVPGVAEAVVVPVNDAEWGARPVAFVAGAAVPPPDELAAAVRRVLPGVAVPVAFVAWEGSAGMKPDRVALARRASGEPRAGGHEDGSAPRS